MPDALTPEEEAALAAYRGPVTVVPVGVGGEVVEHDYKRRIWAEAEAKAHAERHDARTAMVRLMLRGSHEATKDGRNLNINDRIPVDLAIKLGVPA